MRVNVISVTLTDHGMVVVWVFEKSPENLMQNRTRQTENIKLVVIQWVEGPCLLERDSLASVSQITTPSNHHQIKPQDFMRN